MLQLMDTYAASWSVFIIAGLESIIVGWIYGKYQMIRTNDIVYCIVSLLTVANNIKYTKKSFIYEHITEISKRSRGLIYGSYPGG